MTLTRAEIRLLLPPLAAGLAMLLAGAALIWSASHAVREAHAGLSAAQAQRLENAERLTRIAEDERAVKEKIEVYQRLRALHILGAERRVEWADALSRIRAARALPDLRYRVERQRLLSSSAGKPGNVELYASTMRVDLALLHEEDLLRFLGDLRGSGNAYYSVRSCSIGRTGQAAASAGNAPRLRAECEIDLITIIDQAAKP
jgi:hypothetical protein